MREIIMLWIHQQLRARWNWQVFVQQSPLSPYHPHSFCEYSFDQIFGISWHVESWLDTNLTVFIFARHCAFDQSWPFEAAKHIKNQIASLFASGHNYQSTERDS
jgi:hypothetical protein